MQIDIAVQHYVLPHKSTITSGMMTLLVGYFDNDVAHD